MGTPILPEIAIIRFVFPEHCSREGLWIHAPLWIFKLTVYVNYASSFFTPTRDNRRRKMIAHFNKPQVDLNALRKLRGDPPQMTALKNKKIPKLKQNFRSFTSCLPLQLTYECSRWLAIFFVSGLHNLLFVISLLNIKRPRLAQHVQVQPYSPCGKHGCLPVTAHRVFTKRPLARIRLPVLCRTNICMPDKRYFLIENASCVALHHR